MFTIAHKRLHKFNECKKSLSLLKIGKIEIDQEINFDSITPKFLSILKQMAPFGPQNLTPVFESGNVVVTNSLSSIKDRHIRFLAGQENNRCVFNVILFI